MGTKTERRMTLPSLHGIDISNTNRIQFIEKNDDTNKQNIPGNLFQNQFKTKKISFGESRSSMGYFRPTWIEIDMGNLCSNVRLLKKYIGKNVHLMAIVKANAYGFGINEIASAAIGSGATWLGVATLDEAMSLRMNVTKNVPILVLGYVQPQHLSIASRYNITVTCVSIQWIEEAIEYAVEFHLKVDTGLNRLRIKSTDEIQSILDIVNSNKYLNFAGIFTHFATSGDMNDRTYFQNQLNGFKEYLNVIPDIKNKIVHCANSDAALCQPEKPFYNMVRLGKSLLGPPPAELNRFMPFQLKHTISLHSSIVLIKKLDENESVGYSGEYKTEKKEWIATLPIGYADGWHQQFKMTHVIIDTIKVPIVGRIAMDQMCIALPEYYPVGTKVTFIGEQNGERITAYDISVNAKQPEAEVLTGLAARIPRLYIHNGSVFHIQNSLLN